MKAYYVGIPKNVGGIVKADVVNEQRDGCVCSNHCTRDVAVL